MSENLVTWTYNCKFCGHTQYEKNRPKLKNRKEQCFDVIMCEQCSSGNLKVGKSIRYAAWERCPADAVYADHHLVRDGVFIITKVQPWQHGTNLQLKGFENKTFNSVLFTSVQFERKTRDEYLAKWRAAKAEEKTND